jgi:hypothetical protein
MSKSNPFEHYPVVRLHWDGSTLQDVTIAISEGGVVSEITIPRVIGVVYERNVEGFPFVTITLLATLTDNYAPPEPSH